MNTEVVIEAKGLCKRYGAVNALKDASFEVRKGEVLGFLGPNGAGKTTTMKILTCYIAPTYGEARIAGSDLFDDPIGVRRAIGYLPESTPLYTEMQVEEYLSFMGEMRGLRGEELNKRVKRAAEQTSVGDVFHKEIRQLSKGYRQRVGLAQALVHEPPILILDEPMSGLDPNQAVEIRDLIREIGKERTVILSTHNLAEVQVTCKRVLIVAKGRIVADDTTDQLRSRAGRPTYKLELVKGEKTPADIKAHYANLEGVESVQVEPKGEELLLEVLPKNADDIRAALFRAAVDGGHTLLGLKREGENLEKVFRELTTTAGQASADGAKETSVA